MKFILYIVLLTFSISNSLLSMYVDIEFKKNQIIHAEIPNDVIAYIISKPDIKKVYELIEKQAEINRLQPVYHLCNSNPQSEQKLFFKIQQALFPCFALMQTCKKYYNTPFKKQVAHKSKEIVYTIFPQGIAFYLLPKITQPHVLKGNFMEEALLLNRLLGCCFNKNRFNQDFIKIFLFFTPQLLAQVAQSSEFENLLKAHTLTHIYNDTLKQYTIYDSSNTVVISCKEIKHLKYASTISPYFNISMPNIKKYRDLYNALFALCMKNIGTINNIIYRRSDNQILSTTLVEHIFWQLARLINNVKQNHSHPDNLNHDELKALFENFFTVLNVLCSFNIVDLSLPAVNYKGNIAQKIEHEFKTNGYPFDIFSQQALENIESCIQSKFNNVRPCEKQNLINPLVDIFLLNLPDEDKKTFNQIYTSKTDYLPFKTLKNILTTAPITPNAIFEVIFITSKMLISSLCDNL